MTPKNREILFDRISRLADQKDAKILGRVSEMLTAVAKLSRKADQKIKDELTVLLSDINTRLDGFIQLSKENLTEAKTEAKNLINNIKSLEEDVKTENERQISQITEERKRELENLESTILTKIDEVISQIPDIKTIKGERGDPGRDGKDGSPDTPNQIKDKLETLEGEDRLSSEAIKFEDITLERLANDITKKIKIIGQTIRSHSSLNELEWSASGHTIDTDVDFANNKITNLANPTDVNDAVNKQFLISSNVPITDTGGYYTGTEVETALQELGGRFNILDTKANILAMTPTAGLVAYATDVERLYIADGTNWIEQPIGGEPRSTNPDMGAEQNSDLSGYGKDYITDKRLANIVLGGNTREENGALRVDSTQDPDTYEIFLRGVWQTLLYDLTYENGDFRHTPLSEEIHVYSGNSVKVGLNGRPIIMQYSADMGAYPSALTLTGGDF